MFTGLVQTKAAITGREDTEAGIRLLLDADHWSHRPELGESVAIDGVCLTLANRAGVNRLAFDVISETLERSTLGTLAPGREVNLEHALRAGDLMGGHVVQGHVDATAAVRTVKDDPDDWRVTIETPAEIAPFIIHKGSITVQGVSLTIAAAHDDGFEIALIPTTLEETTLSELRPGDRVNLEADMLVKAVVQTTQRMLESR